MKKLFQRLMRLFIFFFLVSGAVAARPLIFVLDGGQEREKEYPAFNEVIEYVAAERTIPCVVSGAILQQYAKYHTRGLEHLFKHFFCFKHAHENLFILTPLESPYSFKETDSYTEYELNVGIPCEHPEICVHITSVKMWKDLLAQDASSGVITFPSRTLTSLLIPKSGYGDQNPSPWVMYLAGHGYYDVHENKSVIVGMRLPLFKSFIDQVMQNHECGFMVLDTCHAGGRQAQRLMNYMTTAEQRFGVEKSFSLGVIGLTHDVLYSSRYPAVRKALNYLFHRSHCDADQKAFCDHDVLDYALNGFTDEALHSRASWHKDRLLVTRNFYKVSKTPQARIPGSNQWAVFPLGTRHIVAVDDANQQVRINEDVVAVLIKKSSVRPHLEFTTHSRTLIISEFDDNKVCFIHRVKALHVELEDFLRYGFFDLVEPHSHLVFRIDSLLVRDGGKKIELTDVLIIKNRTPELIGSFGCAYFKDAHTFYKAVVSYHPDENPEAPLDAVENLEIDVQEISASEYETALSSYKA